MSRDDVTGYRWLVLGLVLSTTVAASTRLWAIFRVDGLSLLEISVLAIFALLFSWIAMSFWVACLGTYALWRNGTQMPLRMMAPDVVPAGPNRSRTVLVMPVYNEDCAQVSARLRAINDSLRETGELEQFDFFLLSDTTDKACLAAEAAAWRQLRREVGHDRIFYRHRENNTERKSGNIAQFCENWGALYENMVVLDADSLMTGQTLVRLVRLMEANPRTALIQVPPLLVGGETLFARTQQFASWVYGRIWVAGFAKLYGADGNYWGHNAIIRVRPFMQHCGLPIMPGRPPLGGEILSHDFVEAALLRRAGWEVWLAPDIGGSFETTPPTLIDHLKRDRRWCQGNLQHILLLFAQGFRLPSRLHFAFGVMGYLSSPLWLILIALFSLHAIEMQGTAPVTYVGRYPVLAWPISHTATFIGLSLAAAFLLYGPKAMALVVMLRDKRMARSFGSARDLTLGILAETALSTLLAPIFMLSHSWFVFNILIGLNAGWGVQTRGSKGIGLLKSALAFWPHTAFGIVTGLLAWYWTPAVFWWYLPLLIGLATAIILCWATSKPSWGAAARRKGLFLVPTETIGVAIVDRVDAILAERGLLDRPRGQTIRGNIKALRTV